MSREVESELLTYGSYLRVPELLELQIPVGEPAVHDEMLFIILQQAQELWFKQILHDIGAVIDSLQAEQLPEAIRLLGRVTRILRVLSEEVEVMESLSPVEFTRFRGRLKPSSGFESEQFRELEFVSGLHHDGFLKLASRVIDMEIVRTRWPVTLHDAFLRVLRSRAGAGEGDPVLVLVDVYRTPEYHFDLFALSEALSEYEMRFLEWRFHHLILVERIIGNRSPGTGGSSGTSYLSKTLEFRLFPELWEARNRISADVLRDWK